MVKKKSNPLKIDYRRCIVEDRLLQIRNKKIIEAPDLVRVWTIDINMRDSKQVVEFIRRITQPKDPISLLHVKRIRKDDNRENVLSVILSSVDMLHKKSEIASLLKRDLPNIEYRNLNNSQRVPRQAAPTKELVVEWSKHYWPLTWYGNPNDQILNDYIFDMDVIRSILGLISSRSREEWEKGNPFPIVTAFVNPTDTEHPIITVDKRFYCGHTVVDHSIMSGVKLVAKRETERRCQVSKGEKRDMEPIYLCLDFEVYTTHEPCSMCAMALIHSRVKRCIFLRSMVNTGCLKTESGNGYCMNNNRKLNSKYEVFQWIGREFQLPSLDENICC